MGQVLLWGVLQGWEPVGVAGLWGAETSVHNVLTEVGVFFESDRGAIGKEVLD